ncbi:CBS domain-containing protein [Anoxybacillus tepidamans]|uniref:CBS domain-containing protein n=1 Tax=Anoxybacteroides tepidamans TaxID=265948 RepID=A0A7W8INL4_9BACL|nr:CBS domain-containing protein [Anoxybacillus tepidamans]MBB5323808.1 CBS domain-containing protein [Anoxybacillus tepidamans]
MTTVREIMTANVDYCTPLDNVFEAAVKMRDLNVGAIPVVENGRLIGMVTDRDLVVRGIAEKRPGSSQVTEVMSKDVITTSPDTSVQEAAQQMAEHQIRRLPVVENGRLVGIVSLGDLATHRYSDESAGRALSDISEQNFLH